MTDTRLEWLASLVAILCTAFRALNLGWQSWSYLASVGAYVVFMTHARGKRSQVVLNGFYIVTALVGAWRWQQ